MDHTSKNSSSRIRDLYPDLPEDQLTEVEMALEKYLELISQIYERIEQDPRTLETLHQLLLERSWESLNAE